MLLDMVGVTEPLQPYAVAEAQERNASLRLS